MSEPFQDRHSDTIKLVSCAVALAAICSLITWGITKNYYDKQLEVETAASVQSYDSWNHTVSSVHSYLGYMTAGIGGDCDNFKDLSAVFKECTDFNYTNCVNTDVTNGCPNKQKVISGIQNYIKNHPN